MTYKVLIENKPFIGSAEEILKTLNNKSFFNKCNSLSEFIKKVQNDIWRLYGIGIQINDEKNASNQLIEQLLHFHLLKPFTLEGLK